MPDFLSVAISLNYGHVSWSSYTFTFMFHFLNQNLMPRIDIDLIICQFLYFCQENIHLCWWLCILLLLTIHVKMLYVQQTFSCTINLSCLAKHFILSLYLLQNSIRTLSSNNSSSLIKLIAICLAAFVWEKYWIRL